MKTIRLIIVLFFVANSLGLKSQTTLTEAVDFTVTDLHGVEHNLFNYLEDGKYVVVDFFAYWCEPCQETAPDFNEVYHMYGCNQGDVIFISLEFQGTTAQTEEFEMLYTGEDGPPTVSGVDGNGGPQITNYDIAAFPTFVLIAPDHSIVEQDIWPMDTGILDGVLSGYNLSHQECAVTGIEETSSMKNIEIYPNPANTSFQVNIEAESYDVYIYNIMGEEVMRSASLNGAQILDIHSLSTGNYLVKVVSDEQSITKRLSVVR